MDGWMDGLIVRFGGLCEFERCVLVERRNLRIHTQRAVFIRVQAPR